MNLLLITIITMGASLVMDELANKKLYKTLGDLGYKANIKNVRELPEYIWDFTTLDTILPIYNVLNRMFKYLRAYNIQPAILEILKKNNIIRPMDMNEKKVYESNPTAANFLKIHDIERKMQESIQSIYMLVDGKATKIYYQVINNKMNIVKVEGTIKERNLSDKEIENLILHSWALMFTMGVKLEGSKFYKNLVKNNRYDITCNPKTNHGIEEMTFNYKYEELEKMYEYFDSQSVEGNKVKTLKKQ